MSRILSIFSSVSKCVIVVIVLCLCNGCGPFGTPVAGFHVWQSYAGDPLHREELALLILDKDVGIRELDSKEKVVWGTYKVCTAFLSLCIAKYNYAVVELKPEHHTLKTMLSGTVGSYSTYKGEPIIIRYNFYPGHIYQIYGDQLSGGTMWRPIIEDVTDKPAGQKWLKEFENCKFRRIQIENWRWEYYPQSQHKPESLRKDVRYAPQSGSIY